MKEAAERAKKELSSAMETEINLPFVTADQSGPKHLVMKLTRAKLEALTQDLVEKTIPPMRAALADAKLGIGDINEVVMVGGQTRMPLVQKTVQSFFNKDLDKSINPDEVVALGAAIQGGVLGGEVKDVLLLDVTPLTLGIETLGGVMTPLIDRNTTIPTRKSQIFSTASDSQSQVEVHVLQGERPMAADNKTLGKFVLDGIPPAPRGVPQIEVAFDIDANGILNVSATDKATNRAQHITITASSGLSKDEVEKMVKQAEQYAADDVKRKEEVEVRNNADAAVYQAEKLLNDMGDKVPAEARMDVEGKVNALRDVMKGREVEPIKRKVQELQEALMKLGESAYAGAGTPPPGGGFGGEGGAGGNSGPSANGSDTVEGEYREV